MRVFLDDERVAPPGWIQVRRPAEAIALLATGQLEEISLDHDLGDDTRGTGYDVILWIEQAIASGGFNPPRIQVHSANPSARLKMIAGVHAIARQFAARASHPPSVGVRFSADGQPLAFRGSTLICPLSEGDGASLLTALTEIAGSEDAAAFHPKIVLLPRSSYHITVFSCTSDVARRPGRWPAAVPLDASIAVCSDYFIERLRATRVAIPAPLRFRMDESESLIHRLPLSFGLVPEDDAEEHKLRALRDQFAACLGVRADHHDHYRFHVTLGYTLSWLSASEDARFQASHARWREQLLARSPRIELSTLDFCTFDNLCHFETRLRLMGRQPN